MPYIDYHIFNKKGVKANMTLVLDEGDSVLECIKRGMQEHGLNEVTIEGVEGTLAEGSINFFERSSYRSLNLKDAPLMMASGNFKLSYGELFGSMKIVSGEKPPIHGTLVKGKAKDGLTIKLSFIQFVDKEPAKSA